MSWKSEPTRSARGLMIVAMLFFLSGAAGLVYEVVWTRLLVGVFGATVLAISTVLAAFMAGLALGSYIFGRIADRSSRPLVVFSMLQIGIGLVSLAVPLLVRFAERAYPGLPDAFRDSFWLLSLARFAWCGLIILAPTTLMGGTLPVLSKWVVGRGYSVGKGAGALYAINTFGAVVGTLAGGFYMIPKLGLSTSMLAAAVVNIVIGLLVLASARRGATSPDAIPAERADGRGGKATASARKRPQAIMPTPVSPEISTRLILGLFAVVGFCSLTYEVLWTRVLIVFVPSTTFAFTTMLGTFLTGIAVGSSISSRFADRLRSPALALGLVEAGIALAALGSLTSFAHLGSIADAVSGAGAQWTSTLAVEFLLPVVIMIVPTLLMGAAFPIVARIRVTDAAGTGRGIGSIYAANTMGSIVGAFASGFILIPLIGIQGSVVLAACGNLAVALIALSRSSVEVRRRLAWAGTAVAAAVVLVLIAPFGRPVALSPGIEGFMGVTQEVVFYDEGISACVTVTESRELDVASFFIDRWPVVGTSYDAMKTVKLLGHLPIVAAREARDVMIVGYGMGMTTWMIAMHDEVESIDVIELSDGVIKASGFFTDVNHNVLDDPRVSIHVDDGRNHLLMARGKYDVISCDPIHPAIGSGALYTSDFFQLARDRLNPGGAFVQYLPFHKMSHFDFCMLIRTFLSVFPNGTVWDGAGHGVLLGTLEPASFDLARRNERLDANPILRADLATCELADPADLMSCLMLDSASAVDLAGDGPINSDNFPLIEFSEPRSVGRDTRYENLAAVTKYNPSPERLIGRLPESDAEFRSRLTHVTTVRRTLASAMREVSRGNVSKAADIIEDAWALEPEDADVRALAERTAMQFWLDRSQEHLRAGRFEQALALCERVLALNPAHSEALVGCGSVYGSQGRFEEAVLYFERAVALAPEDDRATAGLAHVCADAGRIDEAARAYVRLGTLENVDPAHVQRGLNFLLTRDLYREATSLAELNVEMHPKDINGLGILGQCYAASGRFDDAIRVWEEALALRPSDTRLRQVLASAYQQAGRTAPGS